VNFLSIFDIPANTSLSLHYIHSCTHMKTSASSLLFFASYFATARKQRSAGYRDVCHFFDFDGNHTCTAYFSYNSKSSGPAVLVLLRPISLHHEWNNEVSSPSAAHNFMEATHSAMPLGADGSTFTINLMVMRELSCAHDYEIKYGALVAWWRADALRMRPGVRHLVLMSSAAVHVLSCLYPLESNELLQFLRLETLRLEGCDITHLAPRNL
jgi:hypothetical protein